MSSSEDKCEFSEDKHKDRRKMESSREVINSTKDEKEGGTDQGGYIRGAKARGKRERFLDLEELG